jgi:hypothetical protein
MEDNVNGEKGEFKLDLLDNEIALGCDGVVEVEEAFGRLREEINDCDMAV